MSVALIEKREGGHLGGTCLNVGCIPTKALLQTAAMLHNAKNGEEFGVKTNGVEFDYPQAAKRREEVVNRLTRGVAGLMKKNKVTVYNGTGSFVEPKKIKVDGNDGETHELEADYVLIATGSAVSTLPGLEFDGEKIISSDKGSRWLEAALRQSDRAEAATRAKLSSEAGTFAFHRADFDSAIVLHGEALELYRELGDDGGVAWALLCLGAQYFEQGDYERAAPFLEEALALSRRIGDRRNIAYTLHNLAEVERQRGDYERAKTLGMESIALAREIED